MSDKISFIARVETDYVGPRTDATYAVNYLPAYSLTHIRAGIEGEH